MEGKILSEDCFFFFGTVTFEHRVDGCRLADMRVKKVLQILWGMGKRTVSS